MDGKLISGFGHNHDNFLARVFSRFRKNSTTRAVSKHFLLNEMEKRKVSEQEVMLYVDIFEHSNEAILITDKNNIIISVNPALIRLTGYSKKDLVGKNPSILSSKSISKPIYQKMWQELNEKGIWQGELIDRRKNGEVYPKWTSISVIRDRKGKIINYIARFTDISECKEAEKKIYHLAHHDILTGLYNRTSFESMLEQAISHANRVNTALAVMFIDMDRFKVINDSLGHDVGDKLLQEVAQRLENSVRDTDFVARIGGDEFIVVLTDIEKMISVAAIAEKIVNNLRQLYIIDSYDVNSSPSIGISMFPEDGYEVKTLMKNADIAMYHAKEQGRNNYQFFTEELNLSVQERLKIESNLKTALAENEFDLYYQPKIHAKTKKIIGVEALVHWSHPTYGLIEPNKFIPICEETGIIKQLGYSVINKACQQLKHWKAQGIFVTVSVNLSAKQLQEVNLVSRLQEIMSEHQIEKNELELEITETAAMQDTALSIRQMEQLNEMGIRLSIDDFGTGFSSLSYLKLFPIQVLKLDRAFVRDIPTDENDRAICAATISLAHKLGLKVVAEGIETLEQQAFLNNLDCDYFQGFLYSKPLPELSITQFIQKNV